MQVQKSKVPLDLMVRLIWWMFLVSIMILGVVSYLALPVFAGDSQPQSQTISTILAVAAGGVALISLWLFRFRTQPKSAAVSGNDPVNQELLRRAAVQELPLALVNFALNEAVAVFGFALVVIEREPSRFLPFGIAALVLSLLMYPQKGCDPEGR